MDPQLLKDRIVRHEMALDYSNIRLKPNQSTDEYFEMRHAYLEKVFGKVGKGVYMEAPFSVDYGYNTEIGENFYANFNLVLLDCSLIKIGNGVMFGPNVTLSCATHPLDPTARVDNHIEWAAEIHIGDKCWLGSNVTVLPGVTIGEGTTVGANSVVNRSLPANCVAVGIPAKVVKKLPGFVEE